MMEILSYFPLAKLETITEWTFINFSTTFCRNVGKQLHQKWLTVFITRVHWPTWNYIVFLLPRLNTQWLFFVILQLNITTHHFFFRSIQLHRCSGTQTFYDQWKNLYSLELHMSRKRFLPTDHSAVSFLDQIQLNSQVRLYLPVRPNSLHRQTFLAVSSFLSRSIFPFFLFSPHTLSLISSSSYTTCHSLSHNAPYVFWQIQLEYCAS